MANIFKAKTLVSRTGIFSHEVIAPNLVYNTGDQIIYGNKDFINNVGISGTGIFNSVKVSNIDNLFLSGIDIVISGNSSVNVYNPIYISGNPVLTGNIDLNSININNIVYTTGKQTIIGLKDFNNLINVSGIQFDVLTTDQVPAHQEGLLYYSDDDKTLNLDTDITDLSLPIGQENWVRAKNLTNSTLSAGTVVYISGAQGNTPLVRKSIATSDGESARTLGVAAHSINNNSKGYFTTFGLVEGINTSAYSVGQTLYLSWETSGAFTGVKPQAPNHMVRIGNVIDQGNNGSIFVTIQNGFEVDELHDVRITNPQNKDGIIYNSASGLWLNTPAALANEVVYNTGNQIVSGNKTFANNIEVQGTGIFNSVDLSNISEFQFSGTNIDLIDSNVYVSGAGWIYISGNPVITGVDLSSYATSANLALTGSTLNTKIDDLSGYANNTFATITNLASTGSALNNKINSLSGYINSSSSNIVFTSGDQTISGNKIFTNNATIYGITSANNINISGTGAFFNTIDLYNVDNLSISGVNITITSGNITSTNPILASNLVYNTGNQSISGEKTFTNNLIVQVSGFFWSGIKIGLNSIVISEESITITGDRVVVQSNLDSYSGEASNIYATIDNLNFTGSNLQTQIDNAVLKNGDQTIYGQKTFEDSVYIHNLYVTGDEFIANTINNYIESPYILLNLTGGAIDGGIFFVTGAGLTGINDYGPIIGFDHSQKFKFGIGRRSDDLSSLSDIASVQELTASGSTLDSKINSLSGVTVLTNGNQTIYGNKLFNNILSGASGIFGRNQIFIGTDIGIGGGSFNEINGNCSSILGGSLNDITGNFNVIGGGCLNLINTSSSVIVGGCLNIIGSCTSITTPTQSLSQNSFIGGGTSNCIVGGCNNVIVGGTNNCIRTIVNNSITPNCNSILGGRCNCITQGCGHSILGGDCNYISAGCWNIVGGRLNTASLVCHNFILGECNTSQGGCFNYIFGQRNTGYAPYATPHISIDNGFGNSINSSCYSTILNGIYSKIHGTYSCNNFIGVGDFNNIGANLTAFSAKYSTILNGSFNSISGTTSANECNNIITYSNILGGSNNSICSDYSTILGGRCNAINHAGATLIGDGASRVKCSAGACTLTLDFCCGISLANNVLFDVNPQILTRTANFNLTTGFNSRMILVNSPAAPVTGYLTSGQVVGFNASLMQIGAGQIQITGSGVGFVINSYNNQYRSAGQYATISVLHTGNNGYIMYGNTI